MVRIPTHRPPTHPGEMLAEEFLKPLKMPQRDLSHRLGVSNARVTALIKNRCGVTADIALRLEALFGMDAQVWMNLQLRWDLYCAQHAPGAGEIKKIERYRAVPATA